MSLPYDYDRIEERAVADAEEALSANHKAVETMLTENLGNLEAYVWLDMINWALREYQVSDKVVDTFVERYEVNYDPNDFYNEDRD